MFCGNCGNSVAEGAKFCDRCGAPMQPATPVQPEGYAPPVVQELPKKSLLLQRVLGVLLLVGAALMLLFVPDWLAEQFTMNTAKLSTLGADILSGVALVSSYLSLLDGLSYRMCGLVSLVAGLALVLDRSGAKKVAVTAVVFYGLSMVHTVLMMVLCRMAPSTLLQLCNVSARVLEPTAAYLRTNREFANRYLQLVLPALALFGLLLYLTTRLRGEKAKLDRGVTCMLITMPCLTLTFHLHSSMEGAMMNALGSAYSIASGQASAAVKEAMLVSVWGILAVFVVLALVLRKPKFTLLALVLGGVALVSMVWSMLTVELPEDISMFTAYFGQEVEAYGLCFLDKYIVGNTLFLLACGLWLFAAGRGAIPAWLQAILAVPLLLVMYTVLFVATMVLHLSPWVPFSEIITALVLCAVSIPMAIVADKRR